MPLLLMVSGVALCHTCCTVPYGVDWPCCSCPIHPAPVLLCPAMRREPPSPSKRKTQLPAQQKRMEDWAVANGYRVVASVAEVGSGVNDKRRKLTALLKRDDWGTLIVEHKDRLTRFGFEWFRLFAEQTGHPHPRGQRSCG